MTDGRPAQARDLHRRALELDADAARIRENRDRLVRQLRAEDTDRWTYPALALAIGCSPQLIAAIIQGRTGRPAVGAARLKQLREWRSK
jgi:hypothetical protein